MREDTMEKIKSGIWYLQALTTFLFLILFTLQYKGWVLAGLAATVLVVIGEEWEIR